MTHDPILAYSWEFVTTLEYEWEVIQGRLSYRWTIWVRNNMIFAWDSCSRAYQSLGLICDRFTRLHEWLPFRA